MSTEIFDPPYFEEMGSGTVNTMVLDERDGNTALTLTTLYKTPADRDRVMQSGFEDGVDESFDCLAALLETLS